MVIPGEPPNPRRPSREAGIQGTGKLTFRTANWHGSRATIPRTSRGSWTTVSSGIAGALMVERSS
jgi:hypothetical protein